MSSNSSFGFLVAHTSFFALKSFYFSKTCSVLVMSVRTNSASLRFLGNPSGRNLQKGSQWTQAPADSCV